MPKSTVVRADKAKVVELRRELDWSQQDLGAASGIHAMTISRIERGTSDSGVELGTLLLLSRCFTKHLGREISIDDLLAESTPPPEPAPAKAVGE